MKFVDVFAGISAMCVATRPLGWQCVGFAEVDPAPSRVLRHHYPHIRNLGDVRAITDEQIAALGPIDVVVGGSPCQDLSVAGKRRGLAGARSSLFHEQVRIFHAARTFCGARFLLWENVPGAFSSHRGRDFAAVVGTLAGCEFGVPVSGWENAGAAVGSNGLVEWRVLDAQFFGLAQRRKRVFAVLDTGNWSDRPPILLEPEGLRGDLAPRREAAQSIAGTVAGGARGRGGYSHEDIPLTPEYAHALRAQHNLSHREDQDTLVPEVAYSLRADGFDASEDGTGRGTPFIPELSHCLNAGGMGRQDYESETFIAFDARQDCVSSVHVAGALGSSHPQAQAVAHAFDARQRDVIQYGDLSGPLDTDGQTVGVQTGMAVRRLTPRECERLQGFPDDYTLVPDPTFSYRVVSTAAERRRGVMRLRYVERTEFMADGPRYKALGNSMATHVVGWIAARLQRATQTEILGDA